MATETGDDGSMLELYRRLLRLRRAEPALHAGAIELLDSPGGVLRYRRTAPDGTATGHRVLEVAINFTDSPVGDSVAPGEWIGGTSVAGPASVETATLGPDEARIIAP